MMYAVCPRGRRERDVRMRTTAVNNVLVTSLQHPCKRPTTMAPGRSSMAPGPRVLPLIGNLHEVGIGKLAPAFPSQQPHRRFAALAKIHGDVMTIGMGSEPWLVLSSPEAVHEAFVSKGSDFAGRPMVTSMKISSGGKGASPVLRALPARCRVLLEYTYISHIILSKFEIGNSNHIHKRNQSQSTNNRIAARTVARWCVVVARE